MNKIRFAMTGASGFVAPRHMEAIKNIGGKLIAALDPNDSIGILDSYFPDCKFFTEFERFDRYLELLRRKDKGIDYLTICSPNFLHDAHARLGLRLHTNVICEKPLVINPWNLDQLKIVEEEFNKKVFSILQLRYHDKILELKKNIEKEKFYKIKLKYITPRGEWYKRSWKYDEDKSGGILMNIGIHLFDMLIFVFGDCLDFSIEILNKKKGKGKLYFNEAEVEWFLSIDRNDLKHPFIIEAERFIEINNKEIEFSSGFKDLHRRSYKKIIDGFGYGIEDVRPSINLIHNIKKKGRKI